jgi:hypothetical protein
MPKCPNVAVGDKAQVAVDAKHTLLVVQEGTHAVPDVEQRSGIAIQAHEALAVAQLNVVADRGDEHGEELNACEAAGIEPHVAKPLTPATCQ